MQVIAGDLSGDQVASLAGHPRLKSLLIQSSTVSAGGFRAFRGQPQLTSLSIFGCALDAAVTQAIGEGLPELKHLSCVFGSLNDAGLRGLGSLERLESLQLQKAQVTDAGLEVIVGLGRLTHLNLDETPVTGTGFRGHKGKLANLRMCYLAQTQFSDEGVLQLAAAAPQLEILILRSTHVTDEGLASLPQLKSLHTLHLRGTKIGDQGLKHLQRVSGLKMLNLPRDRFSKEALKELHEAVPNCVYVYE